MVQTILDAAVHVMSESGVAGLNMHELAKRVGIRAPSLYEYFAGRLAIYDALFAYGVRLAGERLLPILGSSTYPTPQAQFAAVYEAFMRFSDEHRVLWQLVYERPVPGFEPSAESYSGSRAILDGTESALRRWVEKGMITPDVDIADAVWMVTIPLHGITALRVSNEPDVPWEESRFVPLIAEVAASMFLRWTPKRDSLRPVDAPWSGDAVARP